MLGRTQFASTALALLVGCGTRTGSELAPTTDAATAAPSDVGIDVPASDVSDSACNARAQALAKDAIGPFCTAMVRLSSIDLSVLGWSLDCGPRKPTTSDQARAVFAPIAPPNTTADAFVDISGETPNDEYVFFRSPGDFGGVAAVSVATGRPLFVGSLSWSALGAVVYPKTFRAGSELPPICPPATLQLRSIDVESGNPVDASALAPVVNVLSRTPIIPALDGALAIANTLVLFYPVDESESGVKVPPKNEWIAFVNAVLLE